MPGKEVKPFPKAARSTILSPGKKKWYAFDEKGHTIEDLCVPGAGRTRNHQIRSLLLCPLSYGDNLYLDA